MALTWNYDEDRPSLSELTDPDDEFARSRQGYPRGYAPSWRGEDAPSEHGNPFYVDDEVPAEMEDRRFVPEDLVR